MTAAATALGDDEAPADGLGNASAEPVGQRWLRLHEGKEYSQFTGHQTRTADDRYARSGATEPTDATAETTATTADKTLTREERTLFAGTHHETSLHVVDAPADGPTAFVVGGMHGDERSGYRAASAASEWSIERGRLVVLPAANALAVERRTRHGEGGDLNRKFPSNGRPSSRLARGLWNVVVEYDPDWLVDLHSSFGIYRSGDGGVGQAVFPTDVDPAPEYAAETVESLNDEFNLRGLLAYRRGGLLEGGRPMLAHRAGARLDIPAFIAETTEEVPLDRQVGWQAHTVEHLLSLFDQGPTR